LGIVPRQNTEQNQEQNPELNPERIQKSQPLHNNPLGDCSTTEFRKESRTESRIESRKEYRKELRIKSQPQPTVE